ncbi:hypothetical protein ACFPES_04455 [Paenibacillus sp. GCM10023248]|uniref:hypothetical protein n=1 Tax=Bacillales TaxID=1385 RepID=UPI002379E7B4|nr:MULTISPECIES: hypothetical protein [Bacillales]MDD9266277.1 hypothetical protein [Paenibacillus sp. MAHUQ-63]MDR6878398.1 hypothetical protein [Bacillus sp. 3255]
MTMLNAMRLDGNSQRTPRKAAEVFPFLEAYIARKEQQALEIEQVVERYEMKRMKEERAYQAMSSLRRMFTGKKPDHHLAVEYIHYVKKPMEQVNKLRAEIARARQIMNESKPGDVITIPDDFEDLMS